MILDPTDSQPGLKPLQPLALASMRFWAAFLCLLPLRLLGALVLGVADCDETFNYWEPTHYVCADPCRNPYDSAQRMVGFNGRA